jgi:glutamate-ammonia-ligase adenylyltransferase
VEKRKIKTPLAIIGLGKLGGEELTYGSDLDMIFVADDKARNLSKLQPVAAEVMALLSAPTELGVAFHTDARLRPDGEKGLLVNTLGAYEEYYRKRAQLWEIQTLTRTRPIAGDLKLGKRFQKMAAVLTDSFSAGRAGSPLPAADLQKGGVHGVARPTSCFSPDWKQQVHKMRLRIEKERTPAGQDALAIKTGTGGLMDAEFIAQTLCLENGWREANTLRALERARETGTLAAGDAVKLIENYRQLRQLERILRRWSFEGETVLPDDPAPYYRVSVRCGFSTPEAFREALAQWRHAIREVYLKFFQP